MRTVRTLLTLGCLSLLLSACTASRPPAYNLPSTDALVPGETYTVGRNENIYAVAQKNGAKLREIIVLNELKPPYILHQGQTITLPAKDRYVAPTPKAAPMDHIDKGHMGPASNGNGGAAGIVSVQEESLAPLSSAPVSSGPLASPSAPNTTTPTKGTTSWTSTPKPVADIPLPDSVDTNQPVAPASDGLTAEPSAPLSATSPKDVLEKNQGAPAPTTQAELKPNDFAPTFGWPVRGTIISGFGPKGKGLDNDGINISAPKGSPVKAAEGGMVAYAGNEMKGFGNLVLIRHEGGWVTAYAHLERLVVAKESIVAKGDMIGTVGTTGGVSSPQLHFETRQDGKPVDPELLIK